MKITVFGTGYVGLVTGVCFAEMGNNVSCVDIDPNKLKMLRDGKSPIYEPGLDTLLLSNIKSNRITFTDDAKTSVNSADIIFIAVGTPPQEDGSADLQYVLKVADTIAEHMNEYKLVVTKSTVPVGTFQKVKEAIEKKLKARGQQLSFDVASNPEFLREGCAIEDCLKPNRVVIGVESQKAQEILTNLYDPFLKNGNPILTMDPASSEMTKYAANAMLATKISLMNEFSRICEKVGADIEAVRKGIGSDHRIGPHFIYAGVGYGGSCFPKDVSALVRSGREVNEELQILNAVEETNQLQRRRFISVIEKNLSSQGKRLAIWGVAFKPGTDDIREAPALDIIQHFLDQQYTLQVYDPVAAENARAHFNNHPAVKFFDDQYAALEGTDALVIPTEWKSFREPDFTKMKSLMKTHLIFDGRNIYSPKYIKQQGFKYHSIGRPQ
ncbi:MAG: tuaD [Pseudobdellovibrio sp.]|jgi:UDPglucose 6-dehydrogenase|nr:tuaD [Pseudobdellovibrio sp.]